jgi:threonylcarbamoyladenosine tRNA methylthiotransferase MtaB
MRFAITTLGCKVNQYDGAAVIATLRRLGLTLTDGAPHGLLVVNTCCVTATAMRKSRQAIRRAVRNAPHAAVLVMGCYSYYDPNAIARILASLNVPPDNAFVVRHQDDLAHCVQHAVCSHVTGSRTHLGASQSFDPHGSTCSGKDVGRNDVSMNASFLARYSRRSGPYSIKTRRDAVVKENVPPLNALEPIDRFPGHQRAFVKVQDGCDAFCSYCIVPYTRTRVRSRSIDEIEQECRTLVVAGHKEIVLSGVFLGAFGRDTAIRRRWNTPSSALPDLVRRVAAIEGLWRLRLSSLEPGDLSAELIDACRETPNFAPHFHLPLQSGSPRILCRMNRQYTVKEYRQAVDRARAAFDRPAITTDVLVAFPTESEEDFAATLDIARYTGFAKIHAFRFSPIKGTAAYTYRRDAPSPSVVKQRMATLAELERELAMEYRRQFLGETMTALVERARPQHPHHCEAMTDRYFTVRFQPSDCGPDKLTGRIVNLRIDETTPDALTGTLMEVLP